VKPASPLPTLVRAPASLDFESREWLRSFRAPGAERDAASVRCGNAPDRDARCRSGPKGGASTRFLAERLDTNRGAGLYKTFHDARRKLRTHTQECGLVPDHWLEETDDGAT
jgi:hypothetical protein